MAASLTACAFDVFHLQQSPAQFTAGGNLTKAFVLEQDVPLTLAHGYRRVLKKGTRWSPVGSIAQGDVYRTPDQVLTVEASNIHEAYIVVASGSLVGFYLPIERSFTPATEKTSLPMAEVR